MPTVEEILRQTGMTEEQIKTLDQKVVTGFTQILSSADQLKEQAELAQRAQRQQYENEIAPALDSWANDKAKLEAEAAFYRAQAEAGKAGGFIPSDAPGFKPQEQGRDGEGRYVAGQNTVPGSPQFMQEIRTGLSNGVSNIGWAMQEYSRLNEGKFLPDSFDDLAREADQVKLPFRDFVAKKYDFNAKRQAMETKERDTEINAKVEERYKERERELAEKFGNNPNMRVAEVSRFTTLDKAVKEGARPDPLSMSREQRHAATSRAIQTEVASNTIQ